MQLKAPAIAAIVFCSLPAFVGVLCAQESDDIRLVSNRVDSSATTDPDYWKRAGPALFGEVVGALLVFGGLYAAEHPCQGNSCSLVPAAADLFIGAPLGAAVGAAIPRGRGLCSGPKRFVRALAGASLGLAVGFAPPLLPAVIVTIPVGSTQFMRRC